MNTISVSLVILLIALVPYALLAVTGPPNGRPGPPPKPTYPFLTSITPTELVRIRCSTDPNQQVITSWIGTAYNVADQTASLPLFGLVGMNIARCLYVNSTWQLTSRELMLYTDPSTGQKLTNWNNPLTGEVNNVMHVANTPVQQVFASAVNLTVVNKDQGVLALDINLLYPNSLARNVTYAPYSPQALYKAGEFFKFIAPMKDITKNNLKQVSELEFSWTRYSPYLPFMKMGNRPGMLFFSAQGAKVKDFNELPAVLKNEINNRVPVYKNAPPCILNSSSESSWTYFAKYFDQYLAGAEFPIPQASDSTPCKPRN